MFYHGGTVGVRPSPFSKCGLVESRGTVRLRPDLDRHIVRCSHTLFCRRGSVTSHSMRDCLGDLRAFQPTTLAGVPAVFELIRKGEPFSLSVLRTERGQALAGVESKVRAGGAVKEAVFHGALSAKRSSRLLFGGITDAVVFNKVKEATGGK